MRVLDLTSNDNRIAESPRFEGINQKERLEVAKLFRRCPNCGKRFQIRLTGKEVLDSEMIIEEQRQPFISEYFSPSPYEYLQVNGSPPAIMEIEKFRYAYRCNHCGHRWSEIRESEEVGTEKGSLD